MKNALLYICCLLLLSSNSPRLTKKTTQELLIGRWVQKQDKNMDSYRYVRSTEVLDEQPTEFGAVRIIEAAYPKNYTRSITFDEDGKVTIYAELGCQLPPHFKPFTYDWKVKSSHLVLVDTHYPDQKPRRMKIHKLNKNVLRAKQVSDRGGELQVRIESGRTFIRGQAVTVFSGKTHIGQAIFCHF